MPTVGPANRSIWVERAEEGPPYPRLEHDFEADVAVVGGGITGLLTALLARRAGRSVVLLEMARVGRSTTGHSTAKVSALHQSTYARLEKDFGVSGTRRYAAANLAGLELIASLVEELGIECEFQRRPAVVFTTKEDEVEAVRREAEAARDAGLDAAFLDSGDGSGLPFEVKAAARVPNQAQFDPYAFARGVARAIVDAGGTIFEQTRATGLDAGDPHVLTTDGASVKARWVVAATHLPFLDRGGHFARTWPSTSYCVALKIRDAPPESMVITLKEPTRSLRPWGEDGVIVAGDDHRTGHDPRPGTHYEALESFAREHFDVASVAGRWAAMDYTSVDDVPYIGRLPFAEGRVLLATGYRKWGLAHAGAAAEIFDDLMAGRDNDWLRLYDANRMDVLPSARKFLQANAHVAKHFVKDRLNELDAPEPGSLGPGEGGIVREGKGPPLAAYRREDGTLVTLSPVCTHLGCHVHFNPAERIWECPCHGSQWDTNGTVLHGPTVENLPREG